MAAVWQITQRCISHRSLPHGSGVWDCRVEAYHSSEAQSSLLPGSICEVCLDAPATGIIAAEWGGDMGICEACDLATRPTEEEA